VSAATIAATASSTCWLPTELTPPLSQARWGRALDAGEARRLLSVLD
jgi:hypothetical protein